MSLRAIYFQAVIYGDPVVCVCAQYNKDDAMFNGDVGTCTMCPNDENMVRNSEILRSIAHDIIFCR